MSKDAAQATNKLTIMNLDDTAPSDSLTAQYNPKELSVDKSVPWQKQKSSKGDQPSLEFTAAEGRTLSLELFFDTYESKSDVNGVLAPLFKMTRIRENAPETDKRPPKVMVKWGGTFGSAGFVGVIEQVGTKYTMFLPDGTPVRATCTVKVKEANPAGLKGYKVKPPAPAGGSGGGGGGTPPAT
jgi:hypothetical protein